MQWTKKLEDKASFVPLNSKKNNEFVANPILKSAIIDATFKDYMIKMVQVNIQKRAQNDTTNN